jgi:hypothetical protein
VGIVVLLARLSVLLRRMVRLAPLAIDVDDARQQSRASNKSKNRQAQRRKLPRLGGM